jgi:hypothetical protein
MRKLLLLIATIVPFFCFSQNLKAVNGALVYEKIFSSTSPDIEELLTKNCSSLRDTKDFFKGKDYISLKFHRAEIDFRSQGGKWGNTAVWIQHPFYANVNVMWKDGKYKVTVSNMKTIVDANGMDFPFNDMFIKKGQINGGGIRGNALQYLDNWLTKTFTFLDKTDNW